MRTTHEDLITLSRPGWNILSWSAQLALALLCAAAIYQHMILNSADLAVFRTNTALWHDHLICLLEFVFIVSLTLPAATRICPKLTMYSAVALLLIQFASIGIQMYQGTAAVLPIQCLYGTLAMFVIWVRALRAPITPRG